MKLKILYGYNGILVALSLAIIFTVSIFWIGTQEDHAKNLNDGRLTYFLQRFMFSLLSSIILCFFIYTVNSIYKSIFKLELRPRYLMRVSLIEFLILAVASLTFVFVGMG